MTDILPFNLSFPNDAVVFVVDEYCQYKKTMIDDYCYTHSPIVVSDIGQLFGELAPPTNKNLLLDCVLKWDDTRQYNHVAEVLRFHTAGLLMTMNKPAAFDPLIRAKVDYLVLFRGRNLRHLRRIYRQYLSGVLDDSAVLSGLFKSLSWGQGLVLDLAAMQSSGRFSNNYYKYSPHSDNTNNSTTNAIASENSYTNLDVALGDWIANGITNNLEPENIQSEQISAEWEIITKSECNLARPTQSMCTHSSVTSPYSYPDTQNTTIDTTIDTTSNTVTEPTLTIPSDELNVRPHSDILEKNTTDTTQTDTTQTDTTQTDTTQTQSWTSYLYSKAWSWLS